MCRNFEGGKLNMKKMFASLLALSMILVGCGGNDDGDKKMTLRKIPLL